MKKYLYMLICLVLVVLQTACSPQPTATISPTAPDFSLPATDGSVVSLADYRGEKPVLLYFHMAVG